MSANSPKACTTNFTVALIARDIEAALGPLTDDVVFFYSNGIRSKDAFAAVMTSSWELVENHEYWTLNSTSIAEADDAAAVI